jgi:hypothetical protein
MHDDWLRNSACIGSPNRTRSGLPTQKKMGKPTGKPDSSVRHGFLGAVRVRFPAILGTGRTGNRPNRPNSHWFGEPWHRPCNAMHAATLPKPGYLLRATPTALSNHFPSVKYRENRKTPLPTDLIKSRITISFAKIVRGLATSGELIRLANSPQSAACFPPTLLLAPNRTPHPSRAHTPSSHVPSVGELASAHHRCSPS